MIKNCYFLIPRPPIKAVQVTGEAFRHPERTSRTFFALKNIKFLYFFSIFWVILPYRILIQPIKIKAGMLTYPRMLTYLGMWTYSGMLTYSGIWTYSRKLTPGMRTYLEMLTYPGMLTYPTHKCLPTPECGPTEDCGTNPGMLTKSYWSTEECGPTQECFTPGRESGPSLVKGEIPGSGADQVEILLACNNRY